MKKLNFGCGSRIASGWTNVDFYSSNDRVVRANLLSGFPFADSVFDVVYSSHVIEHFSPENGAFLMDECRRVLKSGGIIRIVVPDLAATCREYLRILDTDDSDPNKRLFYNWVTIEMLDQQVRSSTGGLMQLYADAIMRSGEENVIKYLRSRTESLGWAPKQASTAKRQWRSVTWETLAVKLTYFYLSFIKLCIPKTLRKGVLNDTHIGERHCWMYDTYGMSQLLLDHGFTNLRFVSFNESKIDGFDEDHLDSNPDGSAYKNVSIYCEAIKR